MNFGRYEIQKELGKGSMGVVYQAHDPQIDRLVALKVLRQDRVSGEDFVQRFMKEARAIGRLSHSNIVTVYDVGNDRESIYIAMEFLDGLPLDEACRDTSFDPDKIVDIGEKVASALDYSHQKGIVHRDIKPSNIMLTRSGEVKITDFGIAHIEDPTATQMTQAGEILGTPNYMSPEQVNGEPVDGRSDLYSLGVILYELSTGKRPYTARNLAGIFHAILNETPEAPLDIEPFVSRGMPSELSNILLKSIEKAPEARFQNGGAMAEALRACIAPAPPHADMAMPEKKSSRMLVAALALGLGVVLAGSGFLYFRNHTGPSEDQILVPQAVLEIESDPTGAQLYIDGAFQGHTPARLELSLGGHEVRLFLPGYYEWEAQVQLEDPETPLSVPLMPEAEGAIAM